LWINIEGVGAMTNNEIRLWPNLEKKTGWIWRWGPALAVVLVSLLAAPWMMGPACPRHVVIATGGEDGAYFRFAQQYKEILARDGIELEIRSTAGTIENISLLADDQSGVTLALAHTIASRCSYGGTPPPVDHDGSQWMAGNGGWQYCPKTIGCHHDHDDTGDMSHHGWGVAALKATEKAGVAVASEEFQIADYFLWAHQYEPVTYEGTTIGKRYGYMTPGWASFPAGGQSMIAIGLYSRALLGHDTSHAAFDDFRDGMYPPSTDAYFNMYAAQVMYRIGGSEWQEWGEQYLAQMMPLQATADDGHAEGSWYWDHTYSGVGGRLFCTVSVLLTLEKYFGDLELGSQ
jgi:hypothetical protein